MIECNMSLRIDKKYENMMCRSKNHYHRINQW